MTDNRRVGVCATCGAITNRYHVRWWPSGWRRAWWLLLGKRQAWRWLCRDCTTRYLPTAVEALDRSHLR